MKNNLHNETSFNDCLHLITKFLVSNSKSIPKIEKKNKIKINGKKNYDLCLKSYYYKSIISQEQTKKFIAFWVISSLLLKKIEFSDTS